MCSGICLGRAALWCCWRQSDPDPHAAPQYTNSGACVALFAPGTEVASACGGARARPHPNARLPPCWGSQWRPPRAMPAGARPAP